jgi:hypothetical protein
MEAHSAAAILTILRKRLAAIDGLAMELGTAGNSSSHHSPDDLAKSLDERRKRATALKG